MMVSRRLVALLPAVLSLVLLSASSAISQDAIKPEEHSFESIDGVKLSGLFYPSKEGGSAPTVLMLHAYEANPHEPVWDDTAKMLASKGYNVFQLDFRGHGKSIDVVPNKFWDTNAPWGRINIQNIQIQGGPGRAALKGKISFKEFKNTYYPMLIQDIAAARTYLDIMNDSGKVNTSTIYLLGVGDAVNLGTLFIATEYLRERSKPNVAFPPEVVSTRRQPFSSDVAGSDYGGAIWLSPDPTQKIQPRDLKAVVISPYAINMRQETQMLFLFGAKDRKSAQMSDQMFSNVLMVESKTGPAGMKLLRPPQTFIRSIKDSAAVGTKLLGNNLGTEKLIEDFLTAVDKERRAKTRKTTDWQTPLYVDLLSFGIR
jgi:hypothetical protein